MARKEGWQEFVGRLDALRADDYVGAADVVKDVAEYLDAHRGALDAAFADLARLDYLGKRFAAAVLATALGRVPDEATALRLACCVETVGDSKLKVAIIHALGQDRYGVGRPSGSWSMNTGLAEVGAPVEPAVAAKLVALAGGGPGQPSRDIHSSALSRAILAVLGFSQSQGPVRLLFEDLAAGMEGGSCLSLANPVAQAMALNTDEASLVTLNRLAESRIPEVREAFSRAALMRGSSKVADSLIRTILDPETPAEVKEELAGRLTFYRSVDAEIWTRMEALVLDCLAHDEEPVDQGIGLCLANGLYQHAEDPGRLMDAVVRIAMREEVPVILRESAVLALSPGPPERDRLRKALEALAFDDTAPAAVRARCVDRSLEFTPSDKRSELLEEFRRRLPEEAFRASRAGR